MYIKKENRFTSNLVLDLAGLGCVFGYGLLAFFSRQHGGISQLDFFVFYALITWLSLLTFAVYAYFHRQAEEVPVARLIFWAVLFRCCGLFGEPLFENDFFRYLWDAYRFVETGTPYGLAPEHFFTDPNVPSIFQGILDKINNPEIPTIYGPTLQFFYALGYFLNPGDLLSLKLVFVIVDILLIELLLFVAPARLVLLYAWCPLVITEIAFSAHPDVIGVSFLIAALVFQQRGSLNSAAVCLAFSVAAKLFALLLVPFILIRAGLRHWLIFIVVLLILYLPFLLQGGTDIAFNVFKWEWGDTQFNSALFDLVKLWLSKTDTQIYLIAVYLIFFIQYYFHYRHFFLERIFFRKSSEKIYVPLRGDWIYGLFFLVSPVINAWYLIWMLPFAVIYPSWWAWTASVAVFLSYITELPLWARLLEFGVIVIAFAYDIYRRLPEIRQFLR